MKRFTTEELQFIRNNYKSLGAAEVAIAIGRTKSSIHHVFSRLDVPKVRNVHQWTEEQIETLIENYKTKGGEETARLVGRSWRAVLHKAARLGIKADVSKKVERQVRSFRAARVDAINTIGVWKQRVKERDGFTCQLCHLHEPLIVTAHHIHPVGDGGSKFDISNGQTLCPNCHALVHAIKHGRKTSAKRLPPDVYKSIKEMLQSGLSTDAVSAATKCNHKTVYAARKTVA